MRSDGTRTKNLSVRVKREGVVNSGFSKKGLELLLRRRSSFGFWAGC